MDIEAIVVRGEDVEPEKVQWLWPQRIPLGELTMLAGNPGIGKSHLAIYVAAQVTKGGKWPDCKEQAEPGSVCILTAEDSLKYTMSVRLLAAGADMKKVLFIVGAKTDQGMLNIYKLPEFYKFLAKGVEDIEDLRMIVIDPITAYMGSADENRNIEVREFLAPLAGLAGHRHIAILGINHLNKDMTKMAIFRMLGSVGFTAAARAVWLVAEDPEEETRRLLLPVKVNIAERPGGLAFAMQRVTVQSKQGPILGSAVIFEATAVKQSADEIFADHLIPAHTKLQVAKKWLKEVLTEKAYPVSTLIEEGKKKRISEKTLRRAREELDVESYARKIGEGFLYMWKLKENK